MAYFKSNYAVRLRAVLRKECVRTKCDTFLPICIRAIRIAAAAVLMAAAGGAAAQWRLFESDFDEEKKPWKEIEARLPAPPRPQNLIPFDAGGRTRHRFYIDAPSLSVGEDGVVRYTLVVQTAGGATNVTFEGMRCETQQQKYYAVGRSDGKWVRAREPQWQRVEYKEINRHHAVLYLEFLCPERHIRMLTARQILETLKRPKSVPTPE